jgi:hypothetical protein
MTDTQTITYLHPPRLERIPAPRYTAADVLGLPFNGQRPTYSGGLKAYAKDRRAHRAYRAWRDQFPRARKRRKRSVL